MQRFYIEKPDWEGGIIDIQDARILFQVNKVLRMKVGSRFTVFDQNGTEQLVEVIEMGKRKVVGNVIEPIKRTTESEIEVNLYQSIPKKPALFELVVQKATELGVSQIFPLITSRTEKHRVGKFERLQTIAIEATEQCRRAKVPTIRHPVVFDEVIEHLDDVYLAYEYEEGKTLEVYLPTIQKRKKANIIIGPEGGFEQNEIDLALKQEIHTFGLGPRILRTETAAIAALSKVLLS